MKNFDRKELVNSLKKVGDWDILIIGGGATGLGIAVDAAARGFKTLLAEQSDFAKGTSSRSTKLVHGGVRYLAQGNISLVREALKERGILLKNAPHLTKNESFIIPCFSYAETILYSIGLWFYDLLSGKYSLGKSKLIRKKSVTEKLPTIKRKGLKAGVLYQDGAFDDTRLALNLAQTAIEKEALVLNYLKVVSLSRNAEGKLSGAQLIEKETGEVFNIKAKVIINATGVFVDDVIKLDVPEAKSLIRPSQGIHLVLDASFLDTANAIMIPHTEDGRVLFAIPWHGKVLLGTTDTPLGTHSLEPRALEKEIDFVLKTAGQFLIRKPEKSDVLSVFAGLRPLAATDDSTDKTKEISRSHKVIISESGLVSVIGGKWTTYRKMAEDTLSKIMNQKMLSPKKCITDTLKIHGFEKTNSSDDFLSFYGSDEAGIKKLVEENSDWGMMLSSDPGIIAAQVIWAVRNEMARTVEDFLARRTRVLFIDAKLAIRLAPTVAQLMSDELGKDASWKESQIQSFTRLAEGYLL